MLQSRLMAMCFIDRRNPFLTWIGPTYRYFFYNTSLHPLYTYACIDQTENLFFLLTRLNTLLVKKMHICVWFKSEAQSPTPTEVLK
jgi:hypothetical protein